jgi:hypothetical protein
MSAHATIPAAEAFRPLKDGGCPLVSGEAIFPAKEDIMNRRTALTLTSMALLFLAAAPKIGLAETNPLIGKWKLNLAKSKYSGSPPPRSTTLTFAGEGPSLTNTAESTDAQGQTTKIVFMHIYDGKPHPTTGAPGGLYDATAYTRVDANTVNFVRTKDGKPVQTGTNVVSADGKTYTVTITGIGANGQPINSVGVYEKE